MEGKVVELRIPTAASQSLSCTVMRTVTGLLREQYDVEVCRTYSHGETGEKGSDPPKRSRME